MLCCLIFKIIEDSFLDVRWNNPAGQWNSGADCAGGYSAGYYSYKWAEVLSADAFGAFEEAGLEDEAQVADIGRRFRDTVLALGGGEAPLAVFTAFRGRGPSTEALLRHSGLTPAAA